MTIPKRIAITREISQLFNQCQLSHVERAPIDLDLARRQHAEYEEALASLGCSVRRIPEAPGCPDAVFIEDTAVVLPEFAIVTRPGAPSRRPEILGVEQELDGYREIRRIEAPGTLDGGDVLNVGRVIFIGSSERTDAEGIRQFARIVQPYGYQVRRVPVHGCLHLKSAVCAVSENAVVVNPRWIDASMFDNLDSIHVDSAEPFGANVLAIGGKIIVPQSHSLTRRRLEQCGFRTLAVDVSELAKAEGGVTCCSLIISDN